MRTVNIRKHKSCCIFLHIFPLHRNGKIYPQYFTNVHCRILRYVRSLSACRFHIFVCFVHKYFVEHHFSGPSLHCTQPAWSQSHRMPPRKGL